MDTNLTDSSDSSQDTQQSIDPRIQNLSYSSLCTLHTCPRKFQLYKLGATELEDISERGRTDQVTFAVGHIIGTGIQNILMGMDQDEIIWRAFLQWDPDLLSDNPKQNKSFFGCLFALNQFRHIYENNYLAGYELVSYANAPACELSFSVALPNGFYYRGFVDAVLQHTITGKVVVLEVKTTSDTAVNPAKFKNSAQAIGYSIVLDAIFPDLSGYEVLYLAYQTKSESYVQIPFEKSFYQRALWIRELLLDVDTIMLYEAAQIYPMHGESCRSFNRDCEYLTTCTLSTQALTESLSPADTQKLLEQRESFQIKITLADLIQSQLSKEANHDSRFNGSGTSQSGSSISATTTEDILL